MSRATAFAYKGKGADACEIGRDLEVRYLLEGSEETPTESGEVWTFMRYQNGKWLLSAIQQ